MSTPPRPPSIRRHIFSVQKSRGESPPARCLAPPPPPPPLCRRPRTSSSLLELTLSANERSQNPSGVSAGGPFASVCLCLPRQRTENTGVRCTRVNRAGKANDALAVASAATAYHRPARARRYQATVLTLTGLQRAKVAGEKTINTAATRRTPGCWITG